MQETRLLSVPFFEYSVDNSKDYGDSADCCRQHNIQIFNSYLHEVSITSKIFV